MVNEFNKKMVIQSHLKKLRVAPNKLLDAYSLFYLLNTPIVQEQIQSKIFVQATISTIGNRLLDVQLPIPKDLKERRRISTGMKKLLHEKEALARRCDSFITL
jgi:type I restriction enzyme M protein